LEGFSDNPDFHSVSIDKMHEGLELNVLVIHIHEPQEFLGQAALIIGDTLHNLRSALDILYWKIMTLNKSSPTKWTRFPIADEREEFKRQIGAALKKQQISEPVHSLAIDSIKPYKTGNFPLWSLHEMNIMDKHQLLIPTFQMMAVQGRPP
jgi:hypothetical protein